MNCAVTVIWCTVLCCFPLCCQYFAILLLYRTTVLYSTVLRYIVLRCGLLYFIAPSYCTTQTLLRFHCPVLYGCYTLLYCTLLCYAVNRVILCYDTLLPAAPHCSVPHYCTVLYFRLKTCTTQRKTCYQPINVSYPHPSPLLVLPLMFRL